jgi:hypothetical protein
LLNKTELAKVTCEKKHHNSGDRQSYIAVEERKFGKAKER